MAKQEATDEFKRIAAERAVEFVASGMVIGLGTGSTVFYALQALAEGIRCGTLRNVAGVPTSIETEQRAQALGIPLTTLEEHPRLDLTIDGADEVDPDLQLIKGMGGALLREKIVAAASHRLIIIADEGKLVKQLGTRSPLPVEVAPFGWPVQLRYLESLGGQPVLRRRQNGEPYVTDNGHYIIDSHFAGIEDPYELEIALSIRPGIVETGLFLDLADGVVVGGQDGVRILGDPG